jgi:hypothetical protein
VRHAIRQLIKSDIYNYKPAGSEEVTAKSQDDLFEPIIINYERDDNNKI